MADIQAKYQKLAQEYAKLKAQHSVLKKAVLDEQSKQSEVKEVLKERDQSIRKYEQEIDSLSFRNQQLTKRVDVLQSELDAHEQKGKRHKQRPVNEPHHHHVESNVIGEELTSKIRENERLHKQVYESSEEHRQIVIQLQERLRVLELENSQHQAVLESTQQKHKDLVDKLQQDKAMLEVKLQSQEKEARESIAKANKSEQELNKVKEELTGRLSKAENTIRDKLPFNDTEHRQFNALNIPAHDRKHQMKAKEVIGQAATLIKELVSGLSNFHTYAEQRSKVYPIDSATDTLSPVNQKFCSYLHENASYLRAIEASFTSFQESVKEDALITLETATGLQDFAERFRKYIAYHQKLLPYQLLSLEEECAISSCSQTLETRNMELHGALKKLATVLSRLESFISVIGSASMKSCDISTANHTVIFQKLAQCLEDLYSVMKDVSKHYNSKVSLEHQLPTASQKLKTTDECVVSSLISLVTSTGKISSFAKSHLDFFCSSALLRPRGHSLSGSFDGEGQSTSPAVTQLRQRAVQYMNSLKRAPAETVPYSTAIQNRKILLSSTESKEGLTQQVASNVDKITKLEQEKEHWMLEAQLTEIKYDKELKKVQQLEAERTNNQHGQVPSKPVDKKPPNSPTSVQLNQDGITQTSHLGKVETTATPGEKDDESREQMIKKHYTNRIAELMVQLQKSDSKSVNFHAECRALQKRLTFADKGKEKVQAELVTSGQQIAQLQDELKTTTSNYKSQLHVMSDHLCSMNEQLTAQKDEIDALKMTTTAKPSNKKGRNK
ncbi:protein phosphatase 1 regulatory subunit 21-like [Ptychodera flava]|uniref:protein phosphatase 1 regulatory subunit 21-like n=1 Tax=Ptychodera flava TaxID=63121 RepID=UPI00396A6344